MNKWELVKLGDVVTFLDNMRVPVKASDRVEGEYPYYGANGQQGTINDYIFDESLVLLAEDGGNFNDPTRPIAYIAKGKYWVNNHAHVLRPLEMITLKYLYWVLAFCNVMPYIKGATRPKLTKTDASRIKIPLPPLATQKRIVKILDKGQELIDKRKRQLEEMDELVKSLFYDMFGDPVTNPMGWEKGIIRDLAVKTQYGTSKKAHETDGEFPVLRMNNITYKGTWDFSSLKYVDFDENEKAKYLVYKGELLFNRTNSKELVGKTAVYKNTEPMAYAGYLVKLIVNEKANSEYISAYLNSNHGKAVLLNMAKSIVGMANINAEELKKIKILIPPVSLQNEFATRVQAIETEKERMQKSLKELEDNFAALMQRVFKGEL